jgi:hypothetical protein
MTVSEFFNLTGSSFFQELETALTLSETDGERLLNCGLLFPPPYFRYHAVSPSSLKNFPVGPL